MSWDISLIGEFDGNSITLFALNYTHNCNPMIRDAGLKEWPYEIDGMDAGILGLRLDDIIREMRDDPAHYRSMNPPNGWGDYDSLLDALIDVRDQCNRFPSATVRMSA